MVESFTVKGPWIFVWGWFDQTNPTSWTLSINTIGIDYIYSLGRIKLCCLTLITSQFVTWRLVMSSTNDVTVCNVTSCHWPNICHSLCLVTSHDIINQWHHSLRPHITSSANDVTICVICCQITSSTNAITVWNLTSRHQTMTSQFVSCDVK